MPNAKSNMFIVPCLIYASLCVLSTLAHVPNTPGNSMPRSAFMPLMCRYPIGYDPDNRGRPLASQQKLQQGQQQSHPEQILRPKPTHPPTTAYTRGEAKTLRWKPPRGYVPRRHQSMPELRTGSTGSTGAPPDNRQPLAITTTSNKCLMPGCQLDPQKHLCTGIWMGTRIIDRVCLKTKD
jgi:hypothetical protein